MMNASFNSAGSSLRKASSKSSQASPLSSTPSSLIHPQTHRAPLLPPAAAPAHAALSCSSPLNNGSSGVSLGVPRQSPLLAPVRAVGAPSRPTTSLRALSLNDHTHRFITKEGSTVCATVTSDAGSGARVNIAVRGSSVSATAPPPSLHWGMYRSLRTQWHHPKDIIPPGSTLDEGTKGTRTPMNWQPEQDAWVTSLTVPGKLLPLSLAMVLYFADSDTYDNPRHGTFMAVPLGMQAGDPSPSGASVVSASDASSPQEASCAVNFAVFARHAAAVSLCIVRVKSEGDASAPLTGSGVLEIALDPVTNRTGDMWHVCVMGLKDIGMMCYGWRADGDTTWETGSRYHPGFILSDPYATRAVPVVLPESAYANAARMPPKLDLTRPVVLASLSGFVQDFDWGGAHVPLIPGQKAHRGVLPLEEAVWAEVDIPTFTTGPEAALAVPLERQGKFLGILDRLQELVSAGVTGVLLGPSCFSGPGMGPWGRNPLCFMAPDTQYAVNGPLAAATELKTVIKALHSAGMEVLMSFEFCITAEGSDAGRSGGLQGMRGLDAGVYYRTMPDGTAVLAAGHPAVRPLILDSLRHWALEYQLDGFCFANAENLAQDRNGMVLDNPPLAEDISQDPLLRGCKLVAAVGNSSLLPREGVRGFPHWGVWMQVNDQFRNDARAYLIENRPALLSSLATRIAGSADLFAPQWDAMTPLPGALAAGRRASFGVNTMAGLGDRMILEGSLLEMGPVQAETLAKSMLLLQFCSAGTPLVSASTLSNKSLGSFLRLLAKVRQEYNSLLSPAISFKEPGPGEPPVLDRSLNWWAADFGAVVDWAAAAGGAAPTNVLAFTLSEIARPAPLGAPPLPPPRSLYFAFNPYDHPVMLILPLSSTGLWHVVCDAGLPLSMSSPPPDGSYELGAKSALLLASTPFAKGDL